MKNWNGTIELRPHWSSHTHVCRCVADASQRAHSISFQGIHLYMVYTGAEIAARGPPSELTACCTQYASSQVRGILQREHVVFVGYPPSLDVYLMYTFCIPFVDKKVQCAQKC